jgi:hypothetical protein
MGKPKRRNARERTRQSFQQFNSPLDESAVADESRGEARIQ